MPTTILDVARKAGVATGTASEIINSGHVHKFSEATIAKVRQAAVDIGYRVNRSAQALRTQRTKMIGIAVYGDKILGAFTQPYVAAVYQGIGEYFASREYKLIFENYSPERGFKHLSDLGNSGAVDGIMFVMLAPQIRNLIDKGAEFLDDLSVPHVVIHSLGRHELPHPNVGVDTDACIRTALEHFTGVHGYRRIGFVGSGNGDTHIGELEAAFNDISARMGLTVEPHWKVPAGYGSASGMQAADTLLRNGGTLPRAMVAADSSIADGLMFGFRRAGVRVPEDIAVIGYGNTVDEFYHIHGLTCIDHRPQYKGGVAAELMLELLEHGGKGKNSIIRPELVVRTSCGCPEKNDHIAG